MASLLRLPILFRVKESKVKIGLFILQRRRGIIGIAVGKKRMRAIGHNRIEHRFKLLQKNVSAVMPQKGGKIGNIIKAARQCMGLRIGQHLQPMFDAAQMIVMGGKGGLLLGTDPVTGSKAGKGVRR